MNKNIAILLFLAVLPLLSTAQNFDEYVRQHQAKFSAHTDRVNREFDEHRQRMNAEYAEMMKKAWQKTDLREALPAPKPPEPPKPTVKPENSTTPTMCKGRGIAKVRNAYARTTNRTSSGESS